jgi:hypothetical protein
LPVWNIDNGQVVHLPIGGGPIIINSHPDLTPSIQAAANAWKSQLAANGVTIDFTFGVCGPLDGGRCIIVNKAPDPQEPTVCAGTHTSADSTGTINGVSNIYIPTLYENLDVRQHTASHELGHLMGLDDSACNPTNTVMWTPAKQGSNNCNLLPPQAAVLPTPSDALPSAKSAFNTGSRSTCPAQ